MHNSVGLARTIYIRCTYGIFGLKITKYTVYIYVYIRFWPTLQFSQSGQDGERRGNDDSKYTNTRKYTHQPSSDEQTHKHTRKHTPTILCRANTQTHASTHPSYPLTFSGKFRHLIVGSSMHAPTQRNERGKTRCIPLWKTSFYYQGLSQ
jgi:hypothetical protein